MKAIEFFELRPIAPWGDYGHALIHGLHALIHQPSDALHVNRAGPICIPVAMLGGADLVVAEHARDALETELGLVEFLPVVFDILLRIRWDHWDPSEYPDILPPAGEPDGYFTEFEHDPSVLPEMDTCWHPRLNIGAQAEYLGPDVPELYREATASDWAIDPASWRGDELFRVDPFSVPFTTAHGKKVLKRLAEGWIRFLPTK